MSVYRPKNDGKPSKYYIAEFVYQGKRFRQSTGCSTKTAAKEWEKDHKKRLELAHAGVPSESRAKRIRNVEEITRAYRAAYKLNPSRVERRVRQKTAEACRQTSRIETALRSQ